MKYGIYSIYLSRWMGKDRLSFLTCVAVRRNLSTIEDKGCERSMVGHRVPAEGLAIEVSNIPTTVEGDRKRK